MCKTTDNSGRVFFIGTGPGNPDLLTIAADRIIRESDVLLYAGSLINPLIIDRARPEALKFNSATLTLEKCLEIMITHAKAGRLVARLHSGDPAIFGAITEQIRGLEKAGVRWRVVPGITAACAAAAEAGISLTQPEHAQGLIITRQAGRTKTSPAASLSLLAASGLPMAIYLSGNLMAEACAELKKALPASTRILCVRRASWPDGRSFWTELGKLEQLVKDENLREHTIFLVFPPTGEFVNSRLYDASFSHKYRK